MTFSKAKRLIRHDIFNIYYQRTVCFDLTTAWAMDATAVGNRCPSFRTILSKVCIIVIGDAKQLSFSPHLCRISTKFASFYGILCRFMYDSCMIFGATYIAKLRINTGGSSVLCRYV